MSGYRAFTEEYSDNNRYQLTYYHNPQRWRQNTLDEDNPMKDPNNWSAELKYLNQTNDDVSDDIKRLPNNKGGIYVFFIKGVNLPFMENYILYVGRCKCTDNQNIRKRAKEYFKDARPLILRMFDRWKEHLYYRCYLDDDNDRICRNEVSLIRAIMPELNEDIPDRIEVQPTVLAFN